MLRFLRLCFGTLVRLFRAHRSLLLENLALRQQLFVLKRRHPRPSLGTFDRLFWVVARTVWLGWTQSLIIVTLETVVRGHRVGFRRYWRLVSRVRRDGGRKQTSQEVRDLIFRMVDENPTWGAPRIHGELLMLGFDVSERTISRRMKRAPRPLIPPDGSLPFFAIIGRPSPRWISSQFRRSPSACSTAFSLSAMIVEVCCTSTSPGIRRARGLSSSCGRRFRLGRYPGF
jgi:hypothetical protein